MLNVPPPTNSDSYPIMWQEIEAAVKSPKKGKSAGVDNIQSELVQTGGEAMIDNVTHHLRVDLVDRRVANTLDSVPDHQSLKERQLTTMPKLLFHQPDQSSK